jgi:hypothetical protein
MVVSTWQDPEQPGDYRFKVDWIPETGWPGIVYPTGLGFWYCEGIVGNNHMTVQIDRTGSVHDIFYPTVGVHSGMATASWAYPESTLNVKMVTEGIKIGGEMYWLDDTEHWDFEQTYVEDTNVIMTTAEHSSLPVVIRMYDFCPKGPYPRAKDGTEIEGIYLKRSFIENRGGEELDLTFYLNENLNLNGGDKYDLCRWEGYLFHFDDTYRTGETGDHPQSNYVKDRSICFGITLKADSGGPDGFGIDGDYNTVEDVQGWVSKCVTLSPYDEEVVDSIMVASFSPVSDDLTMEEDEIRPAISWFYETDIGDVQALTENYWKEWLSQGPSLRPPRTIITRSTRGLYWRWRYTGTRTLVAQWLAIPMGITHTAGPEMSSMRP